MKHSTLNSSYLLGKKYRRTRTSLLVLSALGMLTPSLSFAAETTEKVTQKKTDDVEVIEVTGLRSSIIASAARKLDSDKIMDGITSEDMSALPDRSVTETLQRVAGVSIDRFLTQDDPEHFSVEGNGVAVRGLTQVRSELNGRSTFSANGGRTLSFGDVPPELLSGVMVYKSPTADQIEGGIGGTIDLETRLPFHQEGQNFAFDIAANYGDLSKETTPSYSALYSNTWDTDIGRIGFLADIAYSELTSRNDSMYIRPFFYRTDLVGYEGTEVAIPKAVDWRSMEFNRKRDGQYVALQWEPSENQELTFTYFNSSYEMEWVEQSIFIAGTNPADLQISDDTVLENNIFQSGSLTSSGDLGMATNTGLANQESQTEDFSLEYSFYNDDFEFSASAQYVKSTTEGLDLTVATNINVPYLTVDITGSTPKVSTDAGTLADTNNYSWDSQQSHDYEREADMLALQGDFKYFLDSETFTAVKVGVRYTDTNSENLDSEYQWKPLAPSWIVSQIVPEDLDNITVAESDMKLVQFNNFFNGSASIPASIYGPKDSWVTDYPNGFQTLSDKFTYYKTGEGPNSWDGWAGTGNYWEDRNFDSNPEYLNKQEEETIAIYAMVDFEINSLAYPVDGNFGVRYVRTENNANGYLLYPDDPFFGNAAYEAISAENDYSNFMPSLNVRVELSDELVLRFAAAMAIARPDYGQLKAHQTLSAAYNQETQDDLDNLEPGEDLPYEIGPDNYVLTSSSDSNPYLEPIKSTQFDLSLEWYYDEGNSAYLALFTKDIDGYNQISHTVESYAASGEDEDGNPWEAYGYDVERPINAATARLSGLELSVNHFFTTLPEPFNGLGVSANYTYIDSSTDIIPTNQPIDTDGQVFDEDMPYRGISETAYNIVGMYEYSDFHVRLAYNWRDKYLVSTNANGFKDDHSDPVYRLPVYTEAAGYLDGSIAYDINENFTIALEANNITNTVSKTATQQRMTGLRNSAFHANDSRYALSLRGKF